MRYLVTILIFIFVFLNLSSASKIEVASNFDFKLALDYAAGNNIDTLLLTTSGGVYTTQDTTFDYLVIRKPVVIIAAPGLENPPILTHSSIDSSALEIFRVIDDVTFDGVVFDGGHPQSHGMKYAIRVGDVTDQNGNITSTKEGLNITINNCYFKDFYEDGDIEKDGHALYFLKPDGANPIHAGTIKITNTTIENTGYEAIRISETEKYAVERCLDTLIVQNCTFINIDNECVRYYADLDPMTDDAYVLLENITIYNSAVRAFYLKNTVDVPETNPGRTILHDVIVSNARLDGGKGRSDYVMEIQGTGAYLSNVDTFMMVFDPFTKTADAIKASKGGTVDTNSIYGFDPEFVDPANGDFTLAEGSPLYDKGHTGQALGDLRWSKYPTALGDKPGIAPQQFTLEQNYPNPFNPSTTIKYTLPGISPVKITIHDVTGRQVAEIYNDMVTAGTHQVTWNAASIASGVYFYKVAAVKNVKIGKMMLIK